MHAREGEVDISSRADHEGNYAFLLKRDEYVEKQAQLLPLQHARAACVTDGVSDAAEARSGARVERLRDSRGLFADAEHENGCQVAAAQWHSLMWGSHMGPAMDPTAPLGRRRPAIGRLG